MLNKAGLALLSIVSVAGMAQAKSAGKMTLIGTGDASAKPEIALVQIDVQSLCYDSASAAKSANAVLANRLVATLQTYGTDVTAAGGPIVRQTETYYNGHDTQTLCVKKWRASNRLTLKTTNLDAIPDIQDRLFTAIGSYDVIDPSQIKQTYADLQQPIFDVQPATRTRLQQEADVGALQNAKAQADAFAKYCGFEGVSLTAISPAQYGMAPIAHGAAIGGSSQTPIIPDEIRLTSTLRFAWSYAGSGSCFR